jgi:hypothetical protein
VASEGADLLMLPIVANTNERHLGFFDNREELLHSTAIFVATHAIHLIHDDDPLFVGLGVHSDRATHGRTHEHILELSL